MKSFGIVMVCLSAILSASCSVYMAYHQPVKKDLSDVGPGTPQKLVHSELGKPVWTGKENNSYVEIYRFDQGYSEGVKTAGTVFCGAADVMTFGLWEVVGTPMEAAAKPKKMTVKIVYDDKLFVTKVEILKFANPKTVQTSVKY